MKRELYRGLFVLVTLLFAGACWAQAYPTRPIHFIFGFPAGSNQDVFARPVAEEMSKRLGQPIVLEFKPGASATIAAKYVANATPDGYTFFYGSVNTTDPLFNKNNAVDAAKDLIPVSRFITMPYLLVARAGLPVNSLQELRAYAKSNPSGLRYASASPSTDLAMHMLKLRSGIEADIIPYKSAPNIVAALLSGEVDLTIGGPVGYLAMLESGKLRGVFVTAAKRSPAMPTVPTAAEFGVPNFELGTNHGLWAPLRTPPEIIQRVRDAAAAALATPAIVEFLRKSSAEAVGSTPEEQARTHEAEMKLWAEAIRASNFQPQ